MNPKLKFYHWLIPVLTIPIFLIFAGFYGWSFYSTITDRSGFWGSMYAYYDLTKIQYSGYKLMSALTLIILVLFQLKFLLTKNTLKLNKTFLIMLFLIGLLVIAEIYLHTKFIGKG